MSHQIICEGGITLDLIEIGSQAVVSLGWDDDPEHKIVGAADQEALFAVLNGVRYELHSDPWTSRIELEDGKVHFRVVAGSTSILSCEVDRKEYERALLYAFSRLGGGHA